MKSTQHLQKSFTMILSGLVGIIIMLVGVFDLPWKDLLRMIAMPPVWVGVLALFLVAVFVPQKVIVLLQDNPFLRPLFGAYTFLGGVIIGSLFNFAYWGFEHPFDYIVKPVYWLGIFGFVLSLFIGFTYMNFFIPGQKTTTSK